MMTIVAAPFSRQCKLSVSASSSISPAVYTPENRCRPYDWHIGCPLRYLSICRAIWARESPDTFITYLRTTCLVGRFSIRYLNRISICRTHAARSSRCNGRKVMRVTPSMKFRRSSMVSKQESSSIVIMRLVSTSSDHLGSSCVRNPSPVQARLVWEKTIYCITRWVPVNFRRPDQTRAKRSVRKFPLFILISKDL